MRTKIALMAAVIFLANCKCKPKPDPYPPGGGRYFRFIGIDSANKMVESYQTSIQEAENDSSLTALLIDMDQLRKYTDTMPGGRRIKYLKLSFAHDLEYINKHGPGRNVGYRSGAFTLVISGCNAAGDYIYFTGNRVLEYCMPCPTSCPPGTASNPRFSRKP